MVLERVLFLTIAVLTHGIVGYALVRAFTDVNPTIGFILEILPDADFLFSTAWGAPFIHRGPKSESCLYVRGQALSGVEPPTGVSS